MEIGSTPVLVMHDIESDGDDIHGATPVITVSAVGEAKVSAAATLEPLDGNLVNTGCSSNSYRRSGPQ